MPLPPSTTFHSDHALPGTRALHCFAVAICAVAALEAVIARQPLIFVLGLGLGFAIALMAHHFVERPHVRQSSRLPAVATRQGAGLRWLLLVPGLGGLAMTLLDLSDLMEGEPTLSYPIAQLALPVLAFLAAIVVGGMAVRSASAAYTARERSLWRAYATLVACGLTAFGLAELAEHGLPNAIVLHLIVVAVVSLALLSVLLMRSERLAGAMAPSVLAGPQTLGIRVDGRAQWVDFLEDCMSLGQRRKILAATLAASGIGPGQNLLDIGCGTGELVVAAARQIDDGSRGRNGYAMGIDATPAMIDLARRRAAEGGIAARFDVAIAEALPLPDAVIDGVTSSFFFHHLPSAVKAKALREMWRVLAPGGRIVITDYGRPQNLLGYIASFPMRFNFHEYVRGQLAGEIEAEIATADIGRPRIARSFLGYINVLVLEKPRT